jgi:hypothetical protein
MTRSLYFWDQAETIKYWETKAKDINQPPEALAISIAMAKQWHLRVYDFQLKAMELCYLFHVAWMPQCFQHAFNVIFALKNKRSPHLISAGNFFDFVLLMDSLLYIFTAYRGWRWDTFLGDLSPE